MLRKFISFILIVILTLTFVAACGDKNDVDDGTGDNSNVSGDNNGTPDSNWEDIGPRPVYDVPRPVRPERLFEEISYGGGMIPYGNGFYTYGSKTGEYVPERGTWEFDYKYYYCNLNDNSLTEQNFDIPDNLHFRYMTGLSDGSLIIAGVEHELGYDDDGFLNYAWYSDILQFYRVSGSSTQLIAEIDIFLAYGNSIAIDEQGGSIYLLTQEFGSNYSSKYYVHSYSMSGVFQYKAEIENRYRVHDISFSDTHRELYAIGVIGSSDGTVDSEALIFILDESKQEFEVLSRLDDSDNYFDFFQCSIYGFYGVSGATLMRFDRDSKTFIELFDLNTEGVAERVWGVYEYEGSYIVLAQNMDSIAKYYRLTLTDSYDGPVETLILAKLGMGRNDLLDAIIADYNFYNPQFYIEVVDYSHRYGDDAVTQLNLDIIRGNAPDIFMLADPYDPMEHLPVHQYIDNGVLVNLAPYMYRDLIFEDYWKSALDSLYNGNDCYITVPSFTVMALIGTPEAADRLRTGSFNDFMEDMKNDFNRNPPNFVTNLTQAEFVTQSILTNIEQFVDYKAGTAKFDSEEFILLLEAAKALKPEIEWDITQLARGLRQLMVMNLRHVSDLESYVVPLRGNYRTTGFAAVHTENSPVISSGTVLIPSHIFGISVSTSNREAAWAFLRDIYEFENANSLPLYGFHMRQDSFHRQADAYNARDNAGMHLYSFTNEDGTPGDVACPSLNDDVHAGLSAHTISLIEQINRIYLFDSSLLNIITEELPAFFAGSKSAADTARVIQSRTQTYLWEMK